MNDIAVKLESIRAGLERLRDELSAGGQPEASARIAAMLSELEPLSPQTQRQPRRRAAGDVAKCPRCTIRSLRPVPDQWRSGRDGQHLEILWRCSSCGHEAWIEETR